MIVYLRNPIEATVSLWSTAVRVGKPIKKIPNPGSEWDYICNHKRTIQIWEENFQEKIIPKLYCKRSFLNGNLLDDFISQIGIKNEASFEIPENVNQSMSYAGIRLLSNLNEVIPLSKYGLFDELRGDIESLIMEAYKDFPKYQPTENELNSYEEYYEESNNWIKTQFFPDIKYLWRENLKKLDNKKENFIEIEEINAISKLISNLLNKNYINILKINDLEKQIKLHQNQIRIFENSTIWRLSRPLRKISDFIKRSSGLN